MRYGSGMRSAMRRSSSASMTRDRGAPSAAWNRRSHPVHGRGRRRKTRAPRPRRAHCRCRGRNARARGAGRARSDRWPRPPFPAERPLAVLLRRIQRLCGIIGAWLLNRNSCPSLSSASSASRASPRRSCGIAATRRSNWPPGLLLTPSRALPDFSLIDQQGSGIRHGRSARPLVAAVFRLHELPGFLPDDAHHAGGDGKAPACGQGRGAPASDLRVGRRETRHAGAIGEVRALLRSWLHRPHRRRSTEHRSRWRKSSGSP